MHSLHRSFWSLQASMFSTWPFSALAGTSEHAQPFDPGKGIRIGRPTGFPGSGRLTMRCALVMLSQDPRGVPNQSFIPGTGHGGRVGTAVLSPTSTPRAISTQCLRAQCLLGGRAADFWLPARFYQSAPTVCHKCASNEGASEASRCNCITLIKSLS